MPAVCIFLYFWGDTDVQEATCSQAVLQIHVVMRFRRCANVIECTYTNLDSIAYYTYAVWYSLLLLGYKPVQHVTVLNTVGNCNTMVSIVIL